MEMMEGGFGHDPCSCLSSQERCSRGRDFFFLKRLFILLLNVYRCFAYKYVM